MYVGNCLDSNDDTSVEISERDLWFILIFRYASVSFPFSPAAALLCPTLPVGRFGKAAGSRANVFLLLSDTDAAS